jgi:hypothetical protein
MEIFMDTTQTAGTVASTGKTSASTWRKSDTMWMLGLYGTAIGAGVLFLPINAGIGGLLPLIVMAIIAFPMTFYAHRGSTSLQSTQFCWFIASPSPILLIASLLTKCICHHHREPFCP